MNTDDPNNTQGASSLQGVDMPRGLQPSVERATGAERSGRPCEFGDLACGQGYWDCGKCRTKSRARAYRNLTAEQKAYDRYVDPMGAYHTDFPAGCSCHISPPCSFCVSGGAERREEDGESENEKVQERRP